jgi:DNA mismatch endonuclease, patch repair protein
MRGNRSRNTRSEMIVRRLLFRLGYRYRIHYQSLPGHPDIAFPGRRKAVLVHGCFWHQHPSESCPLRSHPQSHLEYWEAKLRRNVERDIANQEKLRMAGWDIIVVWECEIRDTSKLTYRLQEFLGPP